VVLILFLTGVAWLSSVRVLKCSVYSTNERNSIFLVDKNFFYSKNTAKCTIIL